MNEAAAVRRRVLLARDRIKAELETLAEEVGPGWEFDVNVVNEKRYRLEGEFIAWGVYIETKLDPEGA